MGSLVQGEEAVRNGASFITHLFNAMLPVSSNQKCAASSVSRLKFCLFNRPSSITEILALSAYWPHLKFHREKPFTTAS